MSSGDVHVERDDDRLHVGYSPADRLWWAVGREGSYGGGNYQAAIDTALSASATSFHGRRPIVVHRRKGSVKFIIRRTRRQPHSQLFQDDVE